MCLTQKHDCSSPRKHHSSGEVWVVAFQLELAGYSQVGGNHKELQIFMGFTSNSKGLFQLKMQRFYLFSTKTTQSINPQSNNLIDVFRMTQSGPTCKCPHV